MSTKRLRRGIVSVTTSGKTQELHLNLRIPKDWVDQGILQAGDSFKYELVEEGLLLRRIESVPEPELPSWALERIQSNPDAPKS